MPSEYRIGFYVNAHDPKAEIFDVFLCHNSEDKPAVREISQKLAERNIKPWLDEEQFRPGTSWQMALGQQIESIKSTAVFVGESAIGPWQNQEIQAFLSQFVKRECPVFAGPVKELVTGPCISQPGIPVSDRCREEFNIGIGSPRAGCGNQIGDPSGSRTTGNGTTKMVVVRVSTRLV